MAEERAGTIEVEVVYALPGQQTLLTVRLPEGATVEEAIRRSGILERHPEIDLACNKVGIFGHARTLDTPLRDRDRVEIYRPITCDPKEVRRQRAAQARRKGAGRKAGA